MVAVIFVVALLCDGATAAAKGRPDLVVRSVSVPPASVQAGTGFASSAAVVNRGRARAPRSQRRFVLASVAVSDDDLRLSVEIDVTPQGISGCLGVDADAELEPVDLTGEDELDLDLAPLTDPCGEETDSNPGSSDWSALKPGSDLRARICLRYGW